MKHIIAGLLLAIAAFTTNAQTTAYAPNDQKEAPVAAVSGKSNALPASNAKNVVFVTEANQWKMIDMQVTGDVAYFNHLDGMNNLHIFVTNSDGVAQMDMKVNAQANGINFKKLKKGLYFLTLVNEATEEKRAFMLNRE